MKKRLSALLFVGLLLFSAWASAEEVSLARKLLLQLNAGSGFSADLTVDIADRNGISLLKKPIQAVCDYIFVRTDTETGAGRHAVSISLPDGEQIIASAALQFSGKLFKFQCSLFGEDWFSASLPEALNTAFSGAKAQEERNTLLKQTGLPSLSALALTILPSVRETAAANEMAEILSTSIDLWLEGFRQGVELGRTEENEVTLKTTYLISANDVKAELGQLLVTIINNAAMLNTLREMAGEEASQAYLNADKLSGYLSAIDALPLTDQLTIQRTVLLNGGTIDLNVHLPLYDAQTGEASVSYVRQSGRKDLPDETSITLQSSIRSIRVTYQQYESMTGVHVYQGEVHSDPVNSTYQVDTAEKSLAFEFMASCSVSEETAEGDTRNAAYRLQLTVTPLSTENEQYEVPNLDVILMATLSSKSSQKASTSVDMKLVIGGEGLNEQITLGLSGKTKKKWDSSIPDTTLSICELSKKGWSALKGESLTKLTRFIELYISQDNSGN